MGNPKASLHDSTKCWKAEKNLDRGHHRHARSLARPPPSRHLPLTSHIFCEKPLAPHHFRGARIAETGLRLQSRHPVGQPGQRPQHHAPRHRIDSSRSHRAGPHRAMFGVAKSGSFKPARAALWGRPGPRRIALDNGLVPRLFISLQESRLSIPRLGAPGMILAAVPWPTGLPWFESALSAPFKLTPPPKIEADVSR